MVGGHVVDNAGVGASTFTYSLNGGVVTVTGIGGNAYEPHYYYIIDELAAGKYVATFKMTSSVARDFRFNIILPNSSYASILPDTKYDFNIATADEGVIAISFDA